MAITALPHGQAHHPGASPWRSAAPSSVPILIPKSSLHFPQALGHLYLSQRLPGSTALLFFLSPETAAAWVLTLTCDLLCQEVNTVSASG